MDFSCERQTIYAEEEKGEALFSTCFMVSLPAQARLDMIFHKVSQA